MNHKAFSLQRLNPQRLSIAIDRILSGEDNFTPTYWYGDVTNKPKFINFSNKKDCHYLKRFVQEDIWRNNA